MILKWASTSRNWGFTPRPPLEPHVGDPHQMSERVREAVSYYAGFGSRKLTGVIGGDHSAAIGSALAHAKLHPELSVLYIDAHADLRDQYQGNRLGTRFPQPGASLNVVPSSSPASVPWLRKSWNSSMSLPIPVYYWPPQKTDYTHDIISSLHPAVLREYRS